MADETPAAVPSVYLDTCCYQRPIEAAGANPDPSLAAEAGAIAEILEACRDGRAVRVASAIVWYEAELSREPELRDQVLDLLAGADREADFDRAAARRAAAWGRARAGRARDCDEMHLACAVGARVTVFCTVDRGLLNRARRSETGRTRVLTPAETAALLRSTPP